MNRFATSLALASATLVAGVAACSIDRASTPSVPVFDGEVGSILQRGCAACHAGAAPASGWNVTSYLGAIACVSPSGVPATLPATSAPILTALATEPHRGLVSANDHATLQTWVNAAAPAFVGTVHAPAVIDPRSPSFHGAMLRGERWSAMVDPFDDNACGRCHAGAPATPTGITSSAPNAPACTTCHTDPGGALACGTCHGNGARIYPPRDPCFFPDDVAGAHAAHVEPSSTHSVGFACSTCHPMPGANVIGGMHGNGGVEVIFDPNVVAPEASYDRATGTCAVACHDRGGAHARPMWTETPSTTCNGCHGSPPANHYPGPCNECHAEANANGTALTGGPLHMNGRVDLGNGDGTCGACHGANGNPWPTTGAHASHKTPTIAAPVACASCHIVPSTVEAPGHLDGVARVTFTGGAVARGAQPAWNGAACTSVACHGANLVDSPPVIPAWNDASHAASQCGACHGIPPSQHTPSTSCERSACHGSEIVESSQGVPQVSLSGRALHVDGIIESGP